jgi:hypothetical protein
LILNDHLYIGGMNFISAFSFSKQVVTFTTQASKLLYKLVAIDTKYILCAGSYILEIYRIPDHKMLEVCKVETSIYDICLVQRAGDAVDYALGTWEGVWFVRVHVGEEPYRVEVLPMKVRQRESINNVVRFRENLLLYADGSQLTLFDRTLSSDLCSLWLPS